VTAGDQEIRRKKGQSVTIGTLLSAADDYHNQGMEHMLKTIAEKMNLQLHAKRAEGSEQVAAGSSAEAPWRKTEFSDLPEICIAMMLACLSPVEVAKLACVSRSFLDASQSDLVWERFLPPPPYVHKLVAVHPNPPSQFACKEVFHHLCQPFVSSNHIQVGLAFFSIAVVLFFSPIATAQQTLLC
jgi:hypothetical protein